MALWFGALFGLGSLAVRASLIESLVTSSHLEIIVPMTAPPLGMTARILLALAMAVIGIAAGAIIARRIARPRPVEGQPRRSAATIVGKAKPRVDTAFAEVPPQQSLPQAAPAGATSGRLWALAVEQAAHPGFRLDAAPLRGGSPPIFDVTQIDMAAPVSVGTDLAEPGDAVQPRDITTFFEPEESIDAQLAGVSERQEFGSLQQAADPVFGNFVGDDMAPEVPADMASVPDFDAEPAQFRPFDAAPAEFAAEPEQALMPVLSAAPEPRVSLALPQGSAAERIVSGELAELSPVELVERLAIALQQRRHAGSLPTGLIEAAASLADFVDPAPAPAAAPEADDALVSVAPSLLTLPAATFAAGVAPLRRFDAPGAGAPVAGANVASAQDPSEAEAALRSALATLQRMSGSA